MVVVVQEVTMLSVAITPVTVVGAVAVDMEVVVDMEVRNVAHSLIWPGRLL